MTSFGIGASVKRGEDYRLMAGEGILAMRYMQVRPIRVGPPSQ